MSRENVQTSGVGSQSHGNTFPPISEGHPNLDDDGDQEAAEEGVDDEEDEEEDVDFNPFLKETPSPDASSSLSSEIEGLDGDVDTRAKSQNITDGNSSKLTENKLQNRDIEDSEHCEEETVMQSGSPGPQNTLPGKHNKRKSSSFPEPEREKENGSSEELYVNDGMAGVLSNVTHSQKPLLNADDGEDDAICRRTRARYSLASFTLDELEAFLQETDDDDDVKNVDDEEEYRKFLAAVLLGGEADNQSAQETQNVEDEDEENDADFEIELEEALESDYDEGIVEKTQAEHKERMGRRPETRQNRRQKASAQYERKLLEQTRRPLRPLLPILPNGALIPIPNPNKKTWMPEFEANPVSSPGDGLINGFTPYQIGQLHSLIHEHVQLLIQTFSLCVLDPSRQDIASQLQGLIFEMLHKRDEVVACRSKPYPDVFFSPPYVCSSVPEVPQVGPAQCASESSTVNAQGACSTQNIQMPAPQNISFRGQDGYVSHNQLCRGWVPSVHCPVLSILDVAPLSLVGRYMDDIYAAVRAYRQRHVESSSDDRYEKEPLFPLPSFPSVSETDSEVLRSSTLSAANTVPPSASQQSAKKTLAATLVERTKKQSVAVVPKGIAKLAQRFFPLFNPALFPHKPPPLAVANRVLFTDAEDELLALGLMEYNSDWKAIQQRFLPCKSKHQIFVRQKNRCSSKAPENPIKAVRRMKTSPLTMLEIQGIQEGLKVFKLDWMSVWKFIVPHRDPSLLPRQWRIALGTQKSYKLDEAKKEKRRLYELKRRKQKAADMANMQLAAEKEECQAEYTGGENCSGDDNVDNGDESYVHEAFLADWRPGTSKSISSECSNIRDKNLPDDLLPQGNHIRQQPNIAIVGRALTGHVHGSPYALNYSQHPYTLSHHASNALQPSNPTPSMTLNSSKSQIHLRPYRARKSNPHVVKLAPDLPPVNLPPSVRVIPKAALEISQHGAYNKVSVPGACSVNSQAGNIVLSHPQPPRPATSYSVKVTRDTTNSAKEKVTNSCAESVVGKGRCVVDERSTDSDLHMHPLLFQTPEDGRLPYYPLNAGTGASSSFSFFSGSQPQLNLTLFHNPQVANPVVDGLSKSLRTKKSSSAAYGIEFHPLLQRTDDTNNELLTASSTARHPSIGLEGKSAQLQNPSHDVQTKTVVHCPPVRAGSRPSSPKEKINELDLEIHLSSSSTKEDIVVSRQVTAHPTRSIASLRNPENAIETSDTAGPSSNNLDSNIHSSVAPSKEIGRCNIDDTSDHSHPGIVMEQEELSDSDEEVEEHVEFECEEMTDSDGEEGSGSEQIAEEGPSFLTEKVATDADGDDQQLGVNTPVHSQGKSFVPRQQTPPFLKLGLAHPKRDTSNSWLSLDSCVPTPTSHSKPKNEGSTTKKGPAAKNVASNRSSRSSKQKSPRVKRLREHDIDMAERLSLGPFSIRTLRKPRNRASRANTGLNIGMNMESSKNDVKDG